jgi:hypothetical protein
MIMELKNILDIDDELSLYLVSQGLRQAARLYIDPMDVFFFLDKSKTEGYKYLAQGTKNYLCMLKPETVNEFEEQLDQMGVSYRRLFAGKVDAPDEKVDAFRISLAYFYQLGKDPECLRALAQAGTNREKGLALGYPEESVNVYNTVVDGEIRDGRYVFNALVRAWKAGIELPTWPAYIAFVPEVFDLVKGVVSPASKEIGERYQRFVREHNPGLAQRVEQQFKDVYEKEQSEF